MKALVRVAMATSFVVALAGCAQAPSDDAAAVTAPQVASPELVAAAKLQPCPESTLPAASPALPDLTLACLGGGPAVNLARLTGVPTVVNVWGSWCTPCRKELPALASVAKKAGAKVRFLGIDYEDDPDSALDFLAVSGAHYPSVRDDDGTLKTGLRIVGLPLTLFVRADGSVAYEWRAPITSEEQLRGLIRDHLGVSV